MAGRGGVQEGQHWWLGHIIQMDNSRITKKIYEARGLGWYDKSPRETLNGEAKSSAEKKKYYIWLTAAKNGKPMKIVFTLI